MLGERLVQVAAEARPRGGQLGKNARGAPDGRVEGIAAPRRRRGARVRRARPRAEAALEVVAEGLPRPVVVLAVLLEVRLDVLRRELGRGREPAAAPRARRSLMTLGEHWRRPSSKTAPATARSARRRASARGRRRRRRVVQISVNVAERLQRQAFVAPGIGHRTAST